MLCSPALLRRQGREGTCTLRPALRISPSHPSLLTDAQWSSHSTRTSPKVISCLVAIFGLFRAPHRRVPYADIRLAHPLNHACRHTTADRSLRMVPLSSAHMVPPCFSLPAPSCLQPILSCTPSVELVTVSNKPVKTLIIMVQIKPSGWAIWLMPQTAFPDPCVTLVLGKCPRGERTPMGVVGTQGSPWLEFEPCKLTVQQ